ncbi:hypothetical protein DFH08DRAFT_1011668 [Mycena albidolilacea]|uniref:Transmembrane protein n=1 Tax=Mycena albidolilacea TaxID=1033008 RepID=A0AAD6ZWU0_9AGAR|nr:hypothetical protein DFH08DRAFT_1011668 [Mycena albidolilacea]
MTTHTAIVDGRDSLIQFGGFWTQTGAPVEFENSITVSVDAGFTATFSFVGTSVTMYGTVAARTLEMQPIWSFVVDGSVTKTYTSPASMAADVHHQALDVAALVHGERLPGRPRRERPTAVPKPKHKSTPAGVIVGPIIGVLTLTAVAVAVFFFWRCRRQEHESPDRPALQLLTANPVLCRTDTPLTLKWGSFPRLTPTTLPWPPPAFHVPTPTLPCALQPPPQPDDHHAFDQIPIHVHVQLGPRPAPDFYFPPEFYGIRAADPAAQEPQASAGGGARAPAACSL